MLKHIKNIKHTAYVAIIMYYCLKFNSLSAVHAVCLLFLSVSVWMMNLAYRISLPSFHAFVSCHLRAPAVHLTLHSMTYGQRQLQRRSKGGLPPGIQPIKTA